ncbi:hypothetical protein ACYBCU_06535 [Klebsiella pneumoniae]|uniref:hypothetical protein n=1 Tax=Klebsiella pneumoniae TaxID=573 RepID=UPI001082FCC2|nr:hypothetical protein [Klebsiella pneumoniae]HBX6069435.1 hypothetical protein [Klebsiella pneumoniae]
MSACVGLRRPASACVGLRRPASACVGLRRPASACVGLRRPASAIGHRLEQHEDGSCCIEFKSLSLQR